MNLNVEFIGRTEDISQRMSTWCRKATAIWVASAWATLKFPWEGSLFEASSRLRAMVVGVEFHRTEPEFLRKYAGNSRVRVALPTDALFHPKVYLFVEGSLFFALLGSSNLTNGGFRKNQEANVALAGHTGERVFQELRSYIEEAFEAATEISPILLAEYEQACAKHQVTAKPVSLSSQAQSSVRSDRPGLPARLRGLEEFLFALRSLANGDVLVGSMRKVIHLVRERVELDLRWNPAGFSVLVGGTDIILAIVEAAQVRQRLQFTHGLAHDRLVAMGCGARTVEKFYDQFQALASAEPISARVSSGGALCGLPLADASGKESEVVDVLLQAAKLANALAEQRGVA